MDVSRHRYPFVILIPLFLSLFLSSFRYKLASRRKQLSSRAACTPPHEPSRVDIQFEYDFKKNIHRYTARNQDDAYALMQACYSPFKCKHCKEYLSPIFEAYPMSPFQPGIALIHVFTDRRRFNNGKTAREYDHYGYHFFERKRKNLSV